MKNIILSLFFTFTLFACKEDIKENHPETHEAVLFYEGTELTNIASYTIFRNNDSIAQFEGGSIGYTYYDDPIDKHPCDLRYTVKPEFLDSVNASTSILMKIRIDGEVVTQATIDVLYGETAELSYSVE